MFTDKLGPNVTEPPGLLSIPHLWLEYEIKDNCFLPCSKIFNTYRINVKCNKTQYDIMLTIAFGDDISCVEPHCCL